MSFGGDEEDDIEQEAASFLYEILGRYKWITIPVLAKRLYQAPKYLRCYMKQYYSGDQFEEFLNQHGDFFYIKNGRVAQYDESFDIGCDEAIQHFAEVLENYLEPMDIKRFRGNIGQAPVAAIDFINRFYPGKEFKKFLLCNSDIFVVYQNNTVWLIELDCVRYFEGVINYYGGYMNFRGYIGQAPRYIIEYINENYPGKHFLEFLNAHLDVFHIDKLRVYLQEE